jgi:hypothetical protein
MSFFDWLVALRIEQNTDMGAFVPTHRTVPDDPSVRTQMNSELVG